MPTYTYRCENPTCSKLREDDHRMTGFKEHHPMCPNCGSICNYEWTPSVIQFAIKDGPSGIAPSKALRLKDHFARNSERVGKRQEERYGHLKKGSLPNYQGQQTENWREAQSMAMSDKERLSEERKDSLEVAATYNEKINSENTKGKVTV